MEGVSFGENEVLPSVHEEIMVMKPISVFAANLARLQLPMPCSQRLGEAL